MQLAQCSNQGTRQLTIVLENKQMYRIMARQRGRIYWVVAVTTSCFILLVYNEIHGIPSTYYLGDTTTVQPHEMTTSKAITVEQHDNRIHRDHSGDGKRQQVLEQQRNQIRNDMKNYEYPNGKYNISATELKDLVMEENGKPIRSMIVTTWRSGSTFLGQIIAAHPSNFYYAEPLITLGYTQVRGPPLATTSLQTVRGLYNCDYEVLDEFMKFGGPHPWILNENAHLKKHCSARESLCSKPEFLGALCKLFPFQTIKVVRLRLNVAQELLTDEDLNVRMVLLVRDPRGTFNSRKPHSWCRENRDCFDPALHCADLVADYKDAVRLREKYPTTFRVIRYEDLAAEPYERVEELANFLGTGFLSEMKNFLDNHTKKNDSDPFSTVRDTKNTPYQWKTKLKFEEVEEIQRSCAAAMEYWGYVPAINSTHQKEFNPVTNYTLD